MNNCNPKLIIGTMICSWDYVEFVEEINLRMVINYMKFKILVRAIVKRDIIQSLCMMNVTPQQIRLESEMACETDIRLTTISIACLFAGLVTFTLCRTTWFFLRSIRSRKLQCPWRLWHRDLILQAYLQAVYRMF